MSLDRRGFIKALGASAILAACAQNDDENSSNSNNSSNPNNSPGSSGYVPDVTRAYFPNEYFARKGITDSYGYVNLSDSFDPDTPDYLYLIYAYGNDGKRLSGIEVSVFDDFASGNKVLMARDPERRHLPAAGKPDPFGDSSNLNGALVSSDGIYNVISMARSFSDFSSIQKLSDAFPSWDPRDMDDLPGYFYIGDWSFNDLKNTTQVLETASLLLTFIAPNPVTAASYAALSKTDFILDNLENLLTFMDSTISGFQIDLNQEFSMYASPFELDLVFFPSFMSSRNSSQRIRDLIPLQPGNYWNYDIGDRREVKGTELVNGKYLMVVNAAGVDEFWGFNEGTLNFYGISEPSIGDIFFEPEIPVGDNFVRRGNVYGRSSSIVSPHNPDLRGTMLERFEVVDLENVIASGKPYGDCFRIKEDFQINVSGPGGTVRDSGMSEHWYAKNVGQVKQTFDGRTAELRDVDVTGNTRSSDSSGSLVARNEYGTLFSRRLADSIKRIKH